jgi:putative transposase
MTYGKQGTANALLATLLPYRLVPRNRESLLTPDLEPTVYGLLRSKAVGLGATVFALNGMTDHVHLVVAIPPKIAVAAFIGQVKGIVSAKLNKSHPTLPSPFA